MIKKLFIFFVSVALVSAPPFAWSHGRTSVFIESGRGATVMSVSRVICPATPPGPAAPLFSITGLNKKGFVITNRGTVDVFIGPQGQAEPDDGYTLPAGQSFTDNEMFPYINQLFCSSSVNTTVHVIEKSL